MVEGSKIKIKHEHVWSIALLRRLRIFYRNIKIIPIYCNNYFMYFISDCMEFSN